MKGRKDRKKEGRKVDRARMETHSILSVSALSGV